MTTRKDTPEARAGHHVVVVSGVDFQAILTGLKRHLVLYRPAFKGGVCTGDLLRLELPGAQVPYLMVRVTDVESEESKQLYRIEQDDVSEEEFRTPVTVVSINKGMGWHDG